MPGWKPSCRREVMNDWTIEIEELIELGDDVVDAVAGGAGQVMDPNG